MISLIDDALKVVKSNHELYNDLSEATLELTGSLPAVPFRAAITALSAEGHTDCNGSVTFGSETKSFSAPGQQMTTTNLLSALPVVTTRDLDCMILIEAINEGGAPIQQETTTPIKIRMKEKKKSVPSPLGGFTSVKESYALSWAKDGVQAKDFIRYGGVDYEVQDVGKIRGFASSELVRKLTFA